MGTILAHETVVFRSFDSMRIEESTDRSAGLVSCGAQKAFDPIAIYVDAPKPKQL